MPRPRSDESRDEFLDRCMGDSEAISDFPDSRQRYAVCVGFWEDRGQSKRAPDTSRLFPKKDPGSG